MRKRVYIINALIAFAVVMIIYSIILLVGIETFSIVPIIFSALGVVVGSIISFFLLKILNK